MRLGVHVKYFPTFARVNFLFCAKICPGKYDKAQVAMFMSRRKLSVFLLLMKCSYREIFGGEMKQIIFYDESSFLIRLLLKVDA